MLSFAQSTWTLTIKVSWLFAVVTNRPSVLSPHHTYSQIEQPVLSMPVAESPPGSTHTEPPRLETGLQSLTQAVLVEVEAEPLCQNIKH